MKLIIESLLNPAMVGAALPAGVQVLERLAGGVMVVDATPNGERALRSWPHVTVRSMGSASVPAPGGYSERLFEDLDRKLEAAQLRRQRLGL
jgi:hypothetical protein